MDNFEPINSPELEQLKAEYSILKQKFNQQKVINDRLIRETMYQRVRGINNISFLSSICGLFVIFAAPFVFHYNPVVNASWDFVIATTIMMLTCIYFNWKYNRGINDANLSNCDLREFAKNVQYTRKKWNDWIHFSFPMLIVWVGWLITEIYLHSSQKKSAVFFIAGLAFGAIVGGFIGHRMNRKLINHCDEILNQIDIDN